MTTYQGPAVVSANGTEYSVSADLEIIDHGGLKEWIGTLTAEGEGAAWEIFNDNDTALQIGDRSGGFVPGNVNLDTAVLDIRGSGPAPFGS